MAWNSTLVEADQRLGFALLAVGVMLSPVALAQTTPRASWL
jgi:hypothetical protein